MALSATAIVPVLSTNSLDAAHADSKVYPPQSGTPTSTNDIGAAEQILRNQTHTLNEVKASLAGATFTGLVTANAGITVASGQDLTLNGASVQGVVGFSTLGRVWLAGRKQLWRARVTLSDADQTVDVDDGDRFTVSATNAAPRVITLDKATIVPVAGETLAFYWNPGTAGGGGTQYTFQRNAGTVVATFVGAQVADTGAVFAEFEFDGTDWRLGNHSGTPNEYVLVTESPRDESWTSYGVVPGAGA